MNVGVVVGSDKWNCKVKYGSYVWKGIIKMDGEEIW